MSKNRNRIAFKKAVNNNEYHILWYKRKYPPFWDDCRSIYHRRRGKLTGLFTHEYRQYRTWKHNRKTQYKMKKINDFH